MSIIRHILVNCVYSVIFLALIAIVGGELIKIDATKKDYYWNREHIACGKSFIDDYRWVEKNVNFTLYRFEKYEEECDIITKLEKDGKYPANKLELLVFVETHQEYRRQFPLMALGTFWFNSKNDHHNVAYYDQHNHNISYWSEDLWPDECQFLAVNY